MKKFILILLSVLMIFQLAGCGDKVEQNISEEDKMKGELSIYYIDYSDQYDKLQSNNFSLTILLNDMKNQYKNLKINPTAFPSHEEFMTQVSTELNVGKGPDLFLMDYANKLNINKLAKNGTIVNMTPYIKNDKTFDIKNYYEPVINAGKINGKQYVLPISFSYTNLFTTKECLKENNVNLEKGYTYKDVLNAISKSINKADEDNQTIPLAQILNRNDYVTMLLIAFSIPVIDYNKDKVILDKDMFREIADFTKKYYPYAVEAFENKQQNKFFSENLNKVDYFICNNQNFPNSLYLNENLSSIEKNYVNLSLPKFDNPNKMSGQIYHYTMINSNSKNKQLAYHASRTMMDIATHKNIGDNFPVNRQRFDEHLNLIMNSNNNSVLDNNKLPIVVSEKQTSEIKSILDNIKSVSLYNIDELMIIRDGINPYISGENKTFDECFNEIVNKLNLYINE